MSVPTRRDNLPVLGAGADLLARVLEGPHPEQAIAQLQPAVLHHMIRHVGLEDSGALIAHVTPAQLSALFDIDLWRSPTPGADEQFDAERFGLWLDVMRDAGVDTAARTIAALDPEVVIGALSHHIRVFDPATLSSAVDDEIIERRFEHNASADIGGYTLVARRDTAWDALIEILAELDSAHSDAFHRLMIGCRGLSNEGREIDGLDDLLEGTDQAMHNRAAEREQRREAQGYVAPAQARALLKLWRVEPAPLEGGAPGERGESRTRMELARADAAPPIAPVEFDLVYLANLLLAGTSLQGRAFTAPEASRAVQAICQLGFEEIARRQGAAPARRIIPAFRVGWRMMSARVAQPAARALIDALGGVECGDRELQRDLRQLRGELARALAEGEPWRACEQFDALASLDLPAWVVLLGLIAECPTLHAAATATRVLSVKPDDFQFFSTASQIDAAEQFLHSLRERLLS